ncbi:MAG: hypothetical protein IJS68_03395 [Clostridia bacterium]|nr:hypothetical protein [Clostridia bacterium]
MCLCVVVFSLLSGLIALPTIKLLESNGFFAKITEVFEHIYTSPSELNETFKEIILSFLNILGGNFGVYWPSIIGFVVSAILLPIFAVNVAEYTLIVITSNRVSSLTGLGYTVTLVSNLGKASKYAGLKLLFDIVFVILEGLLFCLYLIFSKGVFLTMLLLAVFVAISIVLMSLKTTILASFAPLMVEERKTATKALKMSGKMTNKAFARTLGGAIVLNLTVLFVNVFFGVFTIGVGLLISLPATTVIIAIFKTINYYNTEGKRYYLTETIIVEPKKIEKTFENKGNE